MDMANNESTRTKEELVKLLKSNIKMFNQMRAEENYAPLDMSDTRFQGSTLTGAKLQNIDFSGADFEYANLVSADLTGCTLHNTLMLHANLQTASFKKADLEGADFTGAQLEGADFSGANMSMAIFSKANFTAVVLDQANLSSTNFCQANLSETNFKTALNLRECIFDKYTRWPGEMYLPKDFNPARGMYGAEEDFSINVAQESQQQGPAPVDNSFEQYTQQFDQSYQQHQPQAYQEPKSLTPDELQHKLEEKIEISGKGLPEIEKKQILLDRKLDYIIASLKVLSERVATAPEGGAAGEHYGYDSGYDPVGGAGGLNAKIQELDDKIENVASILTRFPVKSLEETYKLTDVITKIESTQGEIYKKLNESVGAIINANNEIQSILGGKLRASYISGLDKMFEETANKIMKTVEDSKQIIIKESQKLDFNIDDTFIQKELERQFSQTTKLLREDIERKLGTHGLFLKQMDEKLEKVREKTDVETHISRLRDDVDTKTSQITDLTDRIAQKHEEMLNHLASRMKILDQKIDVMSQTSSLNMVSNLIAEFGSGFSSELEQVKNAALAIENRLKGMTGEVDLSTDFAIDAIASSVNTKLGDTIAAAIQNAHMPTGELKELADMLNHKLDLIGKIFDAKTQYLENKMKETFTGAPGGGTLGIEEDIRSLKEIAASLDKQIKELENVSPEERIVEKIKESLKDQMSELICHAQEMAESDSDNEIIRERARSLADMNSRINEKLDQIYNRSDVLEEKVDEIAQSELEDLMKEFSEEIDELRDSIGLMDANTRETIKIQGISSQEVINNLREDLSASVDEVIQTLKTMEDSGSLAEETSKLESFKQDITEKAELLKTISDRISHKMENLFESVHKKTSQLEQKVDILAQAETDSSDVINELLADFEKDVNDELGSLRDMLNAISEKINDPSLNSLNSEHIAKTIIEQMQYKVEDAVEKTNKAIIQKITGVFEEDDSTTLKQISEDEYDDSMQGDIQYIKDVVADIHSKLPELNKATLEKIESAANSLKDKLKDLEYSMITGTGSLESVMNEIVKESSSLPAASKAFDINEDLKQLKTLASSFDTALKDVTSLAGKSISDTPLKDIKSDLDQILARAQELAEQSGVEEISSKVNNLSDISDKIKEIASQVGDNIDISDKVQELSHATTDELLEEFSAELEDLRDYIHTSNALTNESIQSQSIINEEIMNNLREDLTASIDTLMSHISGGTTPAAQAAGATYSSTGAFPVPEDKQKLMQEVSGRISSKIDSLLDTIQKKTQVLEQKVDILAQTETDSSEVLNELLADFKEELLHELKGTPLPDKGDITGDIQLKDDEIVISRLENLSVDLKEINEKITSIEEIIHQSSSAEVVDILSNIEKNIEEKIENLKESAEVLSESIEKLDETSYDGLVKRIDGLIENGITIDYDVLMDNIKGELESKISELDLERLLTSSVGELSHKIEKLYEDVMDLTISLESKIEDMAEKDPSDELFNISESINKLKEHNLEVSTRLEQLSRETSSDAITDIITEVETSVTREVEYLKGIVENLKGSFSEFENIVDTSSVEKNLNELIEFNNSLNTKIDKVLDATGNIDSDALVARIKDHLEDKLTEVLDQDVGLERILDNLGSDLSDKLVHLMDHNQEIDTKLDKLMDQERVDQISTVLSELHTLKTISHNINQKVDHLNEEVDFVEVIENFQNEVQSSISMFNEAAKAETLVSSLNATLETFYNGIMEKTSILQEKVDTIAPDDIAEGLDNVMTDISLLRNLTEDITEKVERIITNTEGLQTEEGMKLFKENLEQKLNVLLESEQFTSENLMKGINAGLGTKIDQYYTSTRDYISDLLSNLEENIISNTTESISIGSFVGEAEERLHALQAITDNINIKVNEIQDIAQNELLTKTDIEDLFSNIDAITLSVNEKTEAIMDRIEKQFDESDLGELKAFRENIENRLGVLDGIASLLRDKFDPASEDYIDAKLDFIRHNVIEKMEDLYAKLLSGTESIENKVDTLASVDVVTQIDSLVSDVLVELDQEVDRIGKLTANVDKNVVTIDSKLRAISRVDQKIDLLGEDLRNLPTTIALEAPKSGTDPAVQSLIEYMQKEADQKLVLMKEIVQVTSGKGSPVEERLKKLEEHISKESRKQDEKLKNVLGSMKTLLQDIEGLKGFNPLEE
jgi:DNA repair exonuclease SbcCD ATPase subunit